jgi:hypothetical protein
LTTTVRAQTRFEDVSNIEHISSPQSGTLCDHRLESNVKSASVPCTTTGFLIGALRIKRSRKHMLGIIAAVLIVLWLLGFLAFHVSSGLIHILLVIGIIMLLLQFFRSRSATA